MTKSKYTCDCTVIHQDIVDKIKNEMIAEEEFTKLSTFFKVFGDRTRIRILWALDCCEMCVCDICSVLGMTKSAISHQLSTLRKAHLVKYRREGKTVYYSLDDEHIKKVFETGLAHIRHIKEGEE